MKFQKRRDPDALARESPLPNSNGYTSSLDTYPFPCFSFSSTSLDSEEYAGSYLTQLSFVLLSSAQEGSNLSLSFFQRSTCFLFGLTSMFALWVRLVVIKL